MYNCVFMRYRAILQQYECLHNVVASIGDIQFISMPVSLDFIPKRNAYRAIFTLPWFLRIFSDMPFCSLILACRFTERENTPIANNKMSSLLPSYNQFIPFFLCFQKDWRLYNHAWSMAFLSLYFYRLVPRVEIEIQPWRQFTIR